MAEKNAYEIPIIIRTTNSGGGGTDELLPMQDLPQSNGREADSAAVSKVKSSANAAKAIAVYAAGKVASTALSNYGNITGDYTTQQNLQASISMATSAASAIALGPVGIATFVVDKGVEVFNYYAQLKRSEVQANFKQQRVSAESSRA